MGSGGSPPRRDELCAERVRQRYSDVAGSGDAVGTEILHRIAGEIAQECGHSLFKAHRLARGWTVNQAVDNFHAMCRAEKLKPRGLVARSWMEWEAGARPSWEYQDLLSRLFQANPIQLGWAADYSPPTPRGSDTAVSSQRVIDPPLQQLPPDIDDFTGRKEQAGKLVELITMPGRRPSTAVPIVAISGKAGVGKTALALHVAHDVALEFPDGQMYANLRGAEPDVLDPAEALAGFLRALGVEGADIPERTDDRARMYRAKLAGRRSLIVLDNAADESQVRPLLPGSPGCVVLVTSRSHLSTLAGSHTIPLEVMPADDAADLLATIIGHDRAGAESDAVAEIIALCGYLPLAIRIAGARLHSRPQWQIGWFAGRLRDESRRLDLLKAGDLEVRASFALSYHSRDPVQQRAFRMTGLAPSNFPAWNLAAILSIDAEHAEQMLEELVDAQLIEVVGVDATGLIRYGHHDLLRDFARECLAADEPAAIRQQAITDLAAAYLEAAKAGARRLQPGALEDGANGSRSFAVSIAEADPQDWFRAERANLVAVVQSAHAAQLWDVTWQLAKAISVFFSWRADWLPWEKTHRLALEAARRIGDDKAEAEVQCSLGLLYRELGKYDAAVTAFAKASEIFVRLGDTRSWATAQRNLGDTYRYQGLLDQALKSFGAALDVFHAGHDQRSIAAALNGMADAHRGLSQWDDALAQFGQSVAIYRSLGDRLEEARSNVRCAMIYRDRHLNGRAEPLITEALEVFRSLGDRRWEARALRHLGVVHRQQDKTQSAIELFGQCLDIFEEISDRRGIAVTLRNRGDAHRWARAGGAAANDLNTAVAIFKELGDRRWTARCYLSIAGMYRTQHLWDEANAHVQDVLQTFSLINDRPARARALRELGMLLRDRGEPESAGQALVDSKNLFEALGDDLWVGRVLASLARLRRLQGADPALLLEEATGLCLRSGITADCVDQALTER
jgi:tetratricopeptide (TPR) repeat protein